MKESYINALGIFLTTVGTVFTLWTVLMTHNEYAGTWNELSNRNKEFPKEKRRVVIGCIMIVIGGILQIIGQFL